jgi:hypothetical protein
MILDFKHLRLKQYQLNLACRHNQLFPRNETIQLD